MPSKKETKIEKVEREYVIPLRKETKKVPRYKKANRAIKTIKTFLVRHMKIYDRDLSKIKIDKYLNEFVWFRGIKKPPTKIKVKAIHDGEIVRVELVDYPNNLKFKKLRKEKIETEGKKAVEKKKTMMQKMRQSMESPTSSKQSGDSSTKEGVQAKPEEKTEGQKKEESEKVKSGEEATQKLEKQKAKSMKTQVGGKEKKKTQPKRMALAK